MSASDYIPYKRLVYYSYPGRHYNKSNMCNPTQLNIV